MDDAEIRSLDELESSHFWYKVRKDQLTKWFSNHKGRNLRILDLGSATGGNTLHLIQLGHRVTSVENSGVGLSIQQSKGIPAVNADARSLPFVDESFDVVICLDLLEHVQEDHKVVEEISRVLVPGGHFLISVPQDPKLWSDHDVSVNHLRRYTKEVLIQVVAVPNLCNFKIWSTIYFLRPLILMARKFTKGSSLRKIGTLPNQIMYYICKLELFLPSYQGSGVTLWMSGQKNSNATNQSGSL